MPKDGSVAPRERINITYKPTSSATQQQVELPFKVLMVGDFSGRPDERAVEERAPISVDKDNFNQVMSEQKLGVTTSVANLLTDEPGGELTVSLEFRSLADFTPDGVAAQVPELQQLLGLRNALVALKGPIGNVPAFRKKIQTLLADEHARQRLVAEIGLPER